MISAMPARRSCSLLACPADGDEDARS